jgi:formylglycine-generating enzyme required for sulfatase activity
MNTTHFALVLAVALSAGCTRHAAEDGTAADGPDGGGSEASTVAASDAAMPLPPVDCTAVKGGPAMVEVASPHGVKYCIDTTEVTQKQYEQFLQSVDTKPGTEHEDCKANTSYAPFISDQFSGGACVVPYGEADKYYAPAKTPDRPVVCIDWCDAVAFCQWAGKRLCGKIGGGKVPQGLHADATVDEWYNACSNGGTTIYAYGNSFQESACPGPGLSADVASNQQCRGAAPPFSDIYDMSGSVTEWRDNCDSNKCNVGPYGGFASDCAIEGLSPKVGTEAFIGFRCCK